MGHRLGNCRDMFRRIVLMASSEPRLESHVLDWHSARAIGLLHSSSRSRAGGLYPDAPEVCRDGRRSPFPRDLFSLNSEDHSIGIFGWGGSAGGLLRDHNLAANVFENRPPSLGGHRSIQKE